MAEPRRYAHGTRVPVEQSVAEMRKLLVRHGATQFVSGWSQATGEHIQCGVYGRRLAFSVKVPDGRNFIGNAFQAEMRRRWRVLVMSVKMRLEEVRDEGRSVDEVFMSEIVLPDGKTMGAHFSHQIAESYKAGTMPAMTLALPPVEGDQ